VVQAVYELDAESLGDGPDLEGWLASEKEPPSGIRLAVVDLKGREGEVVTTSPLNYECDDSCPHFFLGARWTEAPIHPLSDSYTALAIAPPAACGPACRLYFDCGGGDGPCGTVPSGLPLPALPKGERSDKGWSPEQAVDLDGDGAADLWFLGRETTRAGSDAWPLIDQIVMQRAGAGWVTVATDMHRPVLPP
jgi:hypothetical protein